MNLTNLQKIASKLAEICSVKGEFRLDPNDPEILDAAQQLEDLGKSASSLEDFQRSWIRRAVKETGDDDIKAPTPKQVLDPEVWKALFLFEIENPLN